MVKNKAGKDKKELEKIIADWKKNDGEKKDYRNAILTMFGFASDFFSYGVFKETSKHLKSVVYSRECRDYNRKLNEIIKEVRQEGESFSVDDSAGHIVNYEGNVYICAESEVMPDTMFPGGVDIKSNKLNGLLKNDNKYSEILQDADTVVLLTNGYEPNNFLELKKIQGKFGDELEGILEKFHTAKEKNNLPDDEATKKLDDDFDEYLKRIKNDMDTLKERYNIKNVHYTMQSYIDNLAKE